MSETGSAAFSGDEGQIYTSQEINEVATILSIDQSDSQQIRRLQFNLERAFGRYFAGQQEPHLAASKKMKYSRAYKTG